MHWHKFDQRSDTIDQRAMPIGSLHIRAWRMRNGRWRLFVVRVDPWTGWFEWWPVEDWYDLVAYDTQWERDLRTFKMSRLAAQIAAGESRMIRMIDG